MNALSRKNVVLGVIVLLVIILAMVIACPFALRLATAARVEATATPPTLPTATLVPTFGVPTATGGVEGDETALPAVPTSTYSSGSTASGAACLPGTWQIDHASVVNYMTLSMIGREIYAFTPLSAEGKLELQISPSQINLLAEDFTVTVGVNLGGMSNISEFDAIISSTGNSNYQVSDTAINLSGVTYNAQGTMSSSIASFTMDFNDLLEIANSLGFAKNLHPVSSKNLKYTCNGDVLTIVVNPYASVTFRRIGL